VLKVAKMKMTFLAHETFGGFGEVKDNMDKLVSRCAHGPEGHGDGNFSSCFFEMQQYSVFLTVVYFSIIASVLALLYDTGMILNCSLHSDGSTLLLFF
jgi:hypothetical protein